MRILHGSLISIFLFCGFLAQAQFATGPIGTSTGGAGRAAVDPSETVLLNPAAVAFMKQYYAATEYTSGSHPVMGDDSGYGVVLSDGTKGNIIPGALSYQQRIVDLPGGERITEQDIQIATGTFILPTLSMGIAAHRLITDSWLNDNTQDNAHLGFLWSPRPWLGFALVGYDLLPANYGVPEETRVSRTLALASHLLILDMFRWRFDLVRPEFFNPNHRINVMTGIETFFRPEFAFRLGCQWEETKDQTNLTAGLGYLGPKLSMDYTYSQDLRVANGYRHMIDLWLPL